MMVLAVALVVPELLKSSRDQNDVVPKVNSKIALLLRTGEAFYLGGCIVAVRCMAP
jgi:hypothetical protein